MSTTGFFQFALRFFMLFSILFVPRIVLAQDTASYCEAPPAVQQALEKLSAVYDEDMPYKLQRERQIAMLEELLKTHPDNFHLKRRYQDIRLTGFFIDKAALRDEYRAQMEKNPNDPAAVFLYARLLVGRETKQAIELATKLTQQAPAFPWAHLYVQKLRERLKDRKDVVVITFNIDDQVGIVESFMKDNKYNFPTLLAETYAEQHAINSIPRNWVVSTDGKVMFEGVGFDNDGEGFLKKALDVIEKVKGATAQP